MMSVDGRVDSPGRMDHSQRNRGYRVSRRGPAGRSGNAKGLLYDFEMGRRDAPDRRARQCRHGAGRSQGAGRWAPKASGLCRTEHMFFKDFEQPELSHERQLAIQEMIIADTEELRRRALDKLRPFQRRDFAGIFREMDGCPVTIRLIDPPLHEFVPARAGAAEGAGAQDRRRAGSRRSSSRAALRIKSYAGSPRLPSVHHLSRNSGDAGRRHHRSGHRVQERWH